MPDEPNDVQAASSAAPAGQPDPAASASPAVNPGVTAEGSGEDPLKNLKAEMQRKLGGLETKLDQFITAFATQQVAQPVQPQPSGGYTDDDLARLAAAGNADAIRALSQRSAIQATTAVNAVQQRANATATELASLISRYPELQQTEHPLTQAALQTKTAYMRAGNQDSDALRLQAIKDTIAANPELVAQAMGSRRAPETQRQSFAGRATSFDGFSSRRTPSGGGRQPKPLPPKALEIAKRMGVKDPAKAWANFEKRQASGQTALGAVAAFINPEDY